MDCLQWDYDRFVYDMERFYNWGFLISSKKGRIATKLLEESTEFKSWKLWLIEFPTLNLGFARPSFHGIKTMYSSQEFIDKTSLEKK